MHLHCALFSRQTPRELESVISGVMQMATVAAWDTEGSSAETSTCAAAAQIILLELVTNPFHGIAPPADSALESFQDNLPCKLAASLLFSIYL